MSFLYWLLFILLVVLGAWWQWPVSDRRAGGVGIILLAMLFLLGWATFGFIVKG